MTAFDSAFIFCIAVWFAGFIVDFASTSLFRPQRESTRFVQLIWQYTKSVPITACVYFTLEAVAVYLVLWIVKTYLHSLDPWHVFTYTVFVLPLVFGSIHAVYGFKNGWIYVRDRE